MAMYGIPILPIITRHQNDSLTRKWYADFGRVVGKLKDIRALFGKLTHLGPKYGYIVNPPKRQLIIKPGSERQASTVFAGSNVEIKQGARVLGWVIVKISWKMQKLNTQNVWKYLVNLLSPLPWMPMHVWRRGFNRSWASSRALHLPWTGFVQCGGAAWPSHTKHRRQRKNPRGKRIFFSPSQNGWA